MLKQVEHIVLMEQEYFSKTATYSACNVLF